MGWDGGGEGMDMGKGMGRDKDGEGTILEMGWRWKWGWRRGMGRDEVVDGNGDTEGEGEGDAIGTGAGAGTGTGKAVPGQHKGQSRVWFLPHRCPRRHPVSHGAGSCPQPATPRGAAGVAGGGLRSLLWGPPQHSQVGIPIPPQWHPVPPGDPPPPEAAASRPALPTWRAGADDAAARGGLAAGSVLLEK